MPKGFSATTLAIIITIILSSSLVGWVVYSNSSAPKVRGVSTTGDFIKPGFSVDVVSDKGTWDMSVFLCEEESECLSSMGSGVRWLTRGGGRTPDTEVFVEAKDSWEKYDFIKVYVGSGWGSEERQFTVAKENVPVDVQVKQVEGRDVIILPTESLMTDFYKIAKFSDLSL